MEIITLRYPVGKFHSPSSFKSELLDEFINDIEQFLNIKTKFNHNLEEEFINKTFSNKRLKALRLLNLFRKRQVFYFRSRFSVRNCKFRRIQ